MFDWTADKDVLLKGPFTFRFNERHPDRRWLRKFVVRAVPRPILS